jgi:hypothetical protein
MPAGVVHRLVSTSIQTPFSKQGDESKESVKLRNLPFVT